jgi:Tol biopolymer transport system component
MQYVEGETLRKMIAGQPLALEYLLSVTLQVADALTAAHARGIVHRDIKSNNIIITPQGQAKVLDFGIAKLLERDGNAAAVEVTVTGQLVGTPSSMSPEQARGTRVDERTDVWSLGVVLYEMITGRAPFPGETANDVIALVLQGEPPPLSHYVSEAPDALQRIVSKALRKDPQERYQTVEEMLADLREVKRAQVVRDLESSAAGRNSAHTAATGVAPRGATNAGEATTARTASSAEYIVGAVKQHRGAVALAAALLTALTLVSAVLYRSARQDNRRTDNPPGPFQTTKTTRLTTVGTATAASVSPDGRYVAYATGEAVRTGFVALWPAGRSSLWVKQISTDRAVEIVPAADVQYKGTTFSPDGEFVYYVTADQDNPEGALYRVSVLGGTSRKILTVINTPVSISPDGKQLAFVRNRPSEGSDALMVADTDGGNERTLATRGGNDWFEEDGPAWSPDGRTIACGIGTDTGGTYLTLAEVPVEGGEPKIITSHRWGQIGRVAWLGDASGLVVIAGDYSNPSFTGTTAQVWHVAHPGGSARKITNDLDGYHHASLGLTSDTRSIVVAQEDTSTRIWVANLDGSFVARAQAFKQVTAGKFEGRHGLSWMPDGRIVYVTKTGDDEDMWLMNGDGTGPRQLTDDAAFDETPMVSLDGRHIYFGSNRAGTRQVWRMGRDGDGAEMLTKDAAISFEPALSPDGAWLAFSSWRSGALALWKMPVGGGEPVRLTDAPAARAVFSPDGKLISCVYFDAEGSGRWRLAVIPATGGRPSRLLDLNSQTVNAPAGLWWTPDSRALVYVETRGGVSNVWRLPLDGAASRQSTDFDSGQIFNLALSQDGRRLAVARGTLTSDVVLISDLK